MKVFLRLIVWILSICFFVNLSYADTNANVQWNDSLETISVESEWTTFESDWDWIVKMDGECTLHGKKVNCDKLVEEWVGLLKMWFTALIIFWIVSLIGFIFWLMMLIHAIWAPIDNKALWILIILFVPFWFILYYFLVKRKFVSTLKE